MSWQLDNTATTERWLRRRGLPHLIPGYRTSEDALTRAVPFLALVFLAEVLGAFSADRRGWREFGVFLVASALMLGIATATNRLRGRRAFSLPDRVDAPELAVFLLVPATLPLLFDSLNWGRAGLMLLQGVAILLATVVVVDFALLPMALWALSESVRTIKLVAKLAAKTLPVLLLIVTFIFLNAEMWQVGADFTGWRYGLTIALLVLVGSAFVWSNAAGRSSEICRFGSWDEVDRWCETAGCVSRDVVPSGAPSIHLGYRAKANIALVLFSSQALQVLAVAVTVFAFYVVFGVLTVPESTVLAWTGTAPTYLIAHFPEWLDGVPLITQIGRNVSIELLTVAGFIGAFAGLQIAISSTTDDEYRREFLGQVSGEVREAVAVSLRLDARSATA